MGWIDSGDTKTIFLHGVLPLTAGIGLCILGCLHLFGVLAWCRKRHDHQVAPVMLGATAEGSRDDEVMTPEAAERAYGPVACEAQLYGMRQKERQAVLEEIFSSCCTHGKSLKEEQSAEQKDLEQQQPGDVVEDIDTRCACAICLRDYEDSDEVMTGSSCNHRFHKSCALLWLTNYSRPKDHCPYCRKEMMSAVEMKKAALDVLGEERVKELAQFPTPTTVTDNNTTTTMSNSASQDTAEIELPTVEQVPDVESGLESGNEER